MYNIIGVDGSPIKLHYNIHRNAHDAVMTHMNLKDIVQGFLKDALLVDEKAGLVTIQKSKYAKSEWKKGQKYAAKMQDMFYITLHKQSLGSKEMKDSRNATVNPGFMERNENAVKFKEQFDKEYKKLSEVAKIAATYKFLNGLQKHEMSQHDAYGVKAPRWIPPASTSKLEYQTLNEKVLREFAELYNKQIAQNRNATKRFANLNELMIENYIEDMCK